MGGWWRLRRWLIRGVFFGIRRLLGFEGWCCWLGACEMALAGSSSDRGYVIRVSVMHDEERRF